MKNKLTFRLVISIVMTLTLLACVMTPIYFRLQRRAYIALEERRVAEFCAGLERLEPFDRDTVADYYERSGVTYRLYVFDRRLVPVYASLELGNRRNFLQRLFGDKLDRFTADGEPFFSVVDDEAAVRLYRTHRAQGHTYYIQIKDSFNGADPVFTFTNRILLYVVIAYILICSAVLVLTISPAVRTIRETTQVAQKIAANDLTVRYKGKVRRDETGELVLSINRMADAIQEKINGLKNYNFLLRADMDRRAEHDDVRKSVIRGITHDLKTPLAVISSQVEMMHDCTQPERKDYYYDSAIEEIGKMSSMISRVLNLTLTEHQQPEEQPRELEISALIGSLCADLRDYAHSKGVELAARLEPDVRLKVTPGRVEHVFRNYLSNAVQNARPGSTVTVSLKRTPAAVRLSVFNEGEPIPEELSDRIWMEGFTTNPDGRIENSGLGLYIVREIARMEDAECGFFRRDGGVEFWFDFPTLTR